ncbi:PASTA domain-containing protein [Methanosarcina sp.]|uniref:PASTA domain-containing protein n=1 Tax=Methanosarcina sp. TaxID=2213 RepID=UPI0029899C2A|nr:PASTA domain-containing protein [Methanosarcina sp.]MDW5549911.1 PASTA domain-containing protein [Methanosarcina sp.]MDW5552515.1 PASTA domain-containing protein [Methanosarcina sp.]MDW5560245.1 PASTA domain-containing protein [Methanosarcina sp.]
MEVKLEQRLTELRAEYESGQRILEDIELKITELENRKKSLSETLLRISGAIDLLEEVLEEKEGVKEPETTVGTRTITGSVEVPNVIKQPLEKAVKILEESGLTAGDIVEQKSVLPVGVMAGDIIRQEPRPGTRSPAGSAVKLVVAVKGKFLPHDRNSLCGAFSDRS